MLANSRVEIELWVLHCFSPPSRSRWPPLQRSAVARWDRGRDCLRARFEGLRIGFSSTPQCRSPATRSGQPRNAFGGKSRTSPEVGEIRARRPWPVLTRLVCAGLGTRRACTSTLSTAATATTGVTFSHGSPKRSFSPTSREGPSCSSASCSPCLAACTAPRPAVPSPAGIHTGSVYAVGSVVSLLEPTAHARTALPHGREARCCTSGSHETFAALTRSTVPRTSCVPPPCFPVGAAATRITSMLGNVSR